MQKSNPFTFRNVGIGIVVLVAAVLLMGSFFVNTEYERTVVTRLGEFNRVVGSGIHMKIPFIEKAHRADTRISSFEYPNVSTATKDGQALHMTITLNHKILNSDQSLLKLYTEFGGRFDYEERILQKMAIDRIKGVVGKYPMEDFMPKRESIRREALDAVKAAALEYGINIEDVQFADVEFSPDFKRNLERVAQMRAQAAQAEQEARKASFEAEKQIHQARGVAESKKLAAAAEAYKIEQESVARAEAIQREGLAKAKALKAQSDVLANSNGLIQLTLAEAEKERARAMGNWDGSSTPQIVMQGEGGTGGSMVPFLNVNGFLNKK